MLDISTVLDLPHAPEMGRASNSVWSEEMPSPRPGSGTRGPRLALQRTLHTGTSQGFAFDPALRRTSAVASRHRQKSSSERESPSWQRDHKSRQAGTGTVSASAHALRSLTRARARSCGASVPRHLTIFGQQHPLCRRGNEKPRAHATPGCHAGPTPPTSRHNCARQPAPARALTKS